MTFSQDHWIRLYLPVFVEFSEDGTMLPRSLVWTDGRIYRIDRVLDIVSAPALKSGGQGDRYKLEIHGQIRYIFFEHNYDYGSAKLGRWFMEWEDTSDATTYNTRPHS